MATIGSVDSIFKQPTLHPFLSFRRAAERAKAGIHNPCLSVIAPPSRGAIRISLPPPAIRFNCQTANAPPPVFFAKGAGYAFIPCPSEKRGTARQSAQPLVSARILRCVAPFGAPSRRSSSGAGPRFSSRPCGLVRQPAPGRGLSPGRSPGAARVPCLRVTPAGAGLIHTTRSNRFAPFEGPGNMEYSPKDVWEGQVLKSAGRQIFFAGW